MSKKIWYSKEENMLMNLMTEELKNHDVLVDKFLELHPDSGCCPTCGTQVFTKAAIIRKARSLYTLANKELGEGKHPLKVPPAPAKIPENKQAKDTRTAKEKRLASITSLATKKGATIAKASRRRTKKSA